MGVWEISVEVTYLGDPLDQVFKTKFLLHVQPTGQDEIHEDKEEIMEDEPMHTD